MIQDEPMAWQVEDHRVLGAGRVSSFVDDEIVTPTGEVIHRQYLLHPGAVAIVAWDETTDAIACLRQYRHPVRMEMVEIPAGLLDVAGEDWQAAAARELAEEAEVAADRWQVLVDICTTPGASQESLRIFLARDTRHSPRPDGFIPDGEEALMRIEWLDREELTQAVFDGRCQSPTLVAGILALDAAIRGDRLERLRTTDAAWPIRALRAAAGT